MSRSGYCDDLDQSDLAMWRGRVMSAIRGKRGQRLLRDLRDSLDAMPVKRLIAHELVSSDGVCALGSAGTKRCITLEGLDPKDHEHLAELFNVAPCLIQEIEYMNDESGPDGQREDAQTRRWTTMRDWVETHINENN